VSQPDVDFGERIQQILSRMAAPVMRMTLDSGSATSTFARAPLKDAQHSQAPEVEETLDTASRASVCPGDAQKLDENDWYVPPVP
jgi:hypothetical protein